jgi:hypothetical protein
MKKLIPAVVALFIFSTLSPMDLWAAPAKTPPKPKIDIKKITLESEEKGVVPSGIPLMVLAEVNASEDVAGPFAVELELKKGKEKQTFKEGIEQLKKGPNSFKWDLKGQHGDGQYVVAVEITHAELKLKDKSTKSFKIGEKKKSAGAGGKSQETGAEKPSTDPVVKAEPDAATTGSSKQSKPKIDIKKITLESEEKGVVPSGIPLMVLAEVNASEDVAGPFAVELELKKGKEKQGFKEGIEKLKKGPNSFKWDLKGQHGDGQYVVAVEITHAELKLKDKSTKSFKIGEKKKSAGAGGKSQETGAEKPSTDPAVKAEPDAVATQATEPTATKTEAKKTKATKTTKSGETKSAGALKEITFAGVKLTGNFTEQSSGVYTGQGEIKPDWDYDIKLNAQGDLTIDTNRKEITGGLIIHVPVLGDIGKVTDLKISPSGINFNGEVREAFKLGPLTLQIAKATALFTLSKTVIEAKAEAGLGINVTGLPGIDEIDVDIESADAGFEIPIEHPKLKVTGSGTVEIPPTPVTPPLKVDLSGNLVLRLDGLSGDGKVEVFDVEVGNGDFNINTEGVISVNVNAGVFEEGVVECGLAKTTLTIDMPKGLLEAGLSQEVKLFDAVTIPGSVKADLEMNARTKILKVSGKAGIPLTGAAVGSEALSLGIKDFTFEMDPYNSTNPKIILKGNAYVSLWTLAGFSGNIENAVLKGAGTLNLPPGLQQLLDMEGISLPVTVDLKSAQMLADLGGDVAGLAIKHFPITGPQILVKNDGVHLKGQVGIANVITIPLGDLVFTKTSSQTTVDADMGIGPFTLAEGTITLPSKEGDSFGFSGKMGIPGLSSQSITGSVLKDGNAAKADLSGMTSIGFITVDALTRFTVSSDKLHADTAEFSVKISKAAKCALAFTSLDINKSAISGIATAKFTGILGAGVSLKGGFSFDGTTILLTYLDAVTLCGISVDDVTLRINKDGVTGSGTISAAGQSKNISITVENDVMKLKGPAGELIAEGMRIVDKLYGTAGDIASEEIKVVGEDADKTLDNLSRMTDPWIKEVVAAARAVKSVYSAIEKVVVEEITKRVKAALEDLKKVADAAVLFAKQAIAAAVDAVCNGIIAMVDGVKAIFSQIEASIPADYLAAYRTIKAKVIEKADAVRANVVTFRDETKAALYDLTGTITAIYQAAIDSVAAEANKIAGSIKKEMDPVIKEVDILLTEIGQEIDLATSAAGDEAKRHYDAAKQKAEVLKKKANSAVSKYKDKVGDLVSPYTKPIIDKIKSDQDKVAKERDAVIAKGIEGLTAAKETLKPVIEPFEAAVKELRDLTSTIGGAAYQKFLEGIGAAGDAMNSALGTAGKGLVKVSDVVGDAAVAVSGAAADVSEAVHDAAVATVNFVQDTGSHAVDVAVDTAQQGYQTATEAANQAANAASQAASQAYQTATQVTAAAQGQVESTVNTVISHLPPISPSSFATGSPMSFSDIQSGIQAVSAKVSEILNALDSYATSAYNTASGVASSVGSAISGGASSVASGISTRWKSATRGISSLIGSSNPAPAPKIDYTAPAISNIAATSTTNSITVTWNTSFNSRTIMFYGATPNLSFSGQDANTTVISKHDGPNYPETTSHSMTVTGLNPGTAYYYIVYAVSGMASGDSTDAGKKGPFLIVTQPSTAIIGGIVKDAAGTVIPGVKIFIGSGTTPAATTDATGRYTLEVNPGAQTISAKKDNYLNSSTTTASLTAGQILPLDFTLADGRVWVSGIVKDAGTNTGLAGASVTLTGLATPIGVTTDANGAFTIALGTTGSNSVQFVMSVTKPDYTAYTASQITLAPGAKMQNVEIKLPRVLPALSAEGVSVAGITASQATVSFTTQANCSAFVQLGLQSAETYAFQTSLKTNKNSFYFDLVALTPSTTYKYKVVLQDGSGNTVVVKEGTFTTAAAVSTSTDIGLNATVTNITGNSAKLNITSAFKTLKHQLVLRDTTANSPIKNQDLGLLVSPVSIDLNGLVDGHSYAVDLTSSLLANVTTGNVIKTATKNVSFQVPALKSIVMQNLKVDPMNIKRGTTKTANVSATARINHAVTDAVLKVFADTTELCSQNMGNLSVGEARITVPLAVTSIPGMGSVTIKFQVQAAGNIQESSVQTINIAGPKNQGKPGGATAV